MRKHLSLLIVIILVSLAVIGCSMFDWGLKNLGNAGINVRLTGALQVDGDVYELATYKGNLYALAVEGSTQVFYEIDEESFELIQQYELVGDPVEDLYYGDRNEGPRLSCFEDTIGSFFIMDRNRASRFWLNPTDNTALHLSVGDNFTNLNIYFSSTVTGFDYIIKYQKGGSIEIWDLVTDAITMSLNSPPDRFLYDATEIEKDGIEYLRFYFYPFVPVGSENEEVRLPVRLTSIDLEYGVIPPSDYPYGAEEVLIDISEEIEWHKWTTEPGFPVKYAEINYFRSGAGYYMVNAPDIVHDGVMFFGMDGTYFETLFIDSDMKPIISDSLSYVYGAKGDRILKYSLE